MESPEAQAYDLLREDVAWAEHVVNVCVHIGLTQDAFDGLVASRTTSARVSSIIRL